MSQPSAFKLSICIATYNRAAFIGTTLERIIAQVTDDCEIVVSDDASTDDTERVVSEYARRCDRLRYIRQETNIDLDRNFDRVVELARGEYCWLMTDDDLLKPGAITAVLEALRRDFSLVLVNWEMRDLTMSRVLQRRWLEFDSDRVYGPGLEEMDRLVCDTGPTLRFIGCIVIKRSIWLAREKEQYYGSLWIHVGVILQKPLPGETLVIAEPFISYRWNNTTDWSLTLFEVLLSLVSLGRSLPLSESAKSRLCGTEPWRSSRTLLLMRGTGEYSLAEYRRWIHPRLRSIREMLIPVLIALLPGMLVNAFWVLYYSVVPCPFRSGSLQRMKSHFRVHLRHW